MFDKDAIAELATAQAIAAAFDAVAKSNSAVALPDNFKLHDLEHWGPNRRRARGNMETTSLPGFAAYVAAHKEDGAAVFVDSARMAAVAVLNLGAPHMPGHADNTATYTAQPTAAYQCMLAIANGQGKTQQAVAEWLEDWAPNIACRNDNGGELQTAKVVGAVRRITIEAMRKGETVVGALSGSRSTLEQVAATSTEPLPTSITLTCTPYHGLAERTFVLRLGIITGDKPSLVLRVVTPEQHAEGMGSELHTLVAGVVGDVPAMLGRYRAL